MIDKSKSLVDANLFAEIKTHANDLKSTYTKLHEDFETYDKYYNMKWESDQSANLKKKHKFLTTSPDARNKVLGAIRLMIATDPQFSIDNGEAMDQTTKDKLESSFNRWWVQSGRAVGRPLHYDMVLSALLYGEMHTACTPVKDLIEMADPKRKDRIQRVGRITPFIFESWSPKNGYPEFDRLGLSAYLREVDMTVGQLVNDFGDLVPANIRNGKRYSPVKLKTWYDLDYCAIWIGDLQEPIWLGPHGYSEIPISVTLTDGSRLFEKPEEQRQPMLYSLLKSGLWEKQNLMLTIIYSAMFGLGATAQFKHWSLDGSRLNVDWDNPAGVAELAIDAQTGKREDFEQVAVTPVAPVVWDTYKLAEEKIGESTIHAQAFGAPVNRVTTFSEMSLLNQSGRLPLITTQRMGGEGLAKVMELAIQMLKKDGEKFEGNGITLNPKEIPDDIQINAKLEVNLPQDKLSLSAIGSNLKNAGLVDDEWIQSNLLNINDTSKMRRNIMRQQGVGVLFGEFLKEKMNELAQAKNPATPPPQGREAGGMVTPRPSVPPDGMSVPAGEPLSPEGMAV